MSKARSRLATQQKESKSSNNNQAVSFIAMTTLFILKTCSKALLLLAKVSLVIVSRYLRYLPLAALATLGWAAVWYIVTNRSPESIQNTILTNGYGLLLISVWWASFFTGCFVFLHTRRGWWLSCWITISLWWRLIHLQPWWLAVSLSLSFFVTIEALITLSTYVKSKRTPIKQDKT